MIRRPAKRRNQDRVIKCILQRLRYERVVNGGATVRARMVQNKAGRQNVAKFVRNQAVGPSTPVVPWAASSLFTGPVDMLTGSSDFQLFAPKGKSTLPQ